MSFIPQWAIGGAVLIFAVALAQIVVVKLRASYRKLPASDQDLEALQNRLAELEERLDFAERLLAQHRDADRLAPPPQ